jgi:hypothetical protein
MADEAARRLPDSPTDPAPRLPGQLHPLLAHAKVIGQWRLSTRLSPLLMTTTGSTMRSGLPGRSMRKSRVLMICSVFTPRASAAAGTVGVSPMSLISRRLKSLLVDDQLQIYWC